MGILFNKTMAKEIFMNESGEDNEKEEKLKFGVYI